MKRIIILAVVAIVAAACGVQKRIASQPQNQSNAPFGEVYSLPCEVYDTNDEFAATGIYRGSSYQKGECQLNALENAKQLVYDKYHHAYNGMISNYSSTIGNNRGNDIATKLQRAGDQVVKAVLNDIQACCIKFSGVQDDGMIECYVGIKVPKQEIAAQVAKTVADVLTPDEKMQINFEEDQYRKQMEQHMGYHHYARCVRTLD